MLTYFSKISADAMILDIPSVRSVLGEKISVCSLDLHLVSLSTGRPHHHTRFKSMRFEHLYRYIKHPSAAIQILGDIIIILLYNAHAHPDDNIVWDQVFAVNWKKGAIAGVCASPLLTK